MNTQNYGEERYSHKNPPTNDLEAVGRLDILEQDVERIQTDLETFDVEDKGTEYDYTEWRRRAIAALGWKNAECKFLNRWLSERKKRIFNARGVVKAQQQESVLRDKFDELVSRWSADIGYIPKFSKTTPPQTMGEILTRRQELLEAKKMAESAMQEILEVSYSFSKKPTGPFFFAKRKMGMILRRVEAEFAVLKQASPVVRMAEISAGNRAPVELSILPGSEVAEMNREISEIKEKLGFRRPTDIAIFLHDLLMRHHHEIDLDVQTNDQLTLIGKWLQLSETLTKHNPMQ